MKSLVEVIARQLRGRAQHLQDTPISGQRYLTTRSRQLEQARREREEFLKELQSITKKALTDAFDGPSTRILAS